MTNHEINSSTSHAINTTGIALLLLADNANPFQWGAWWHTAVQVFFWTSAISAILLVIIGLLIKILEKFE